MRFLVGLKCFDIDVTKSRCYLLFEDSSSNAFKFKRCITYTNGHLEDHVLVVMDYDTKDISLINLKAYIDSCSQYHQNWVDSIVGVSITYTGSDLLVNYELFDISNLQDKYRLAVMNLIYSGKYFEKVVNMHEKVAHVLIPDLATSLAGGVVVCTKYWDAYNPCSYGEFDNDPNQAAVNLLADLVMQYLLYGACHVLTLVDNTHSHKLISTASDLYRYLKSAVIINKRGSDFIVSLRCPVYDGKYATAYKEMNWVLSENEFNKLLVTTTKLNVLNPDYLKLDRVFNNRLDVKNWNLEEFLNGKDA